MNYQGYVCSACGSWYGMGTKHVCHFPNYALPMPGLPAPYGGLVPPSTSLDTNPLFLALVKRMEKLEDEIQKLKDV